MNESIENLKNYFLTEEGKKSLYNMMAKYDFECSIDEKYIEKFHNLPIEERKDIIGKICTKYNSASYTKREYDMSYEPRKDLFWLYDSYAEKYGNDVYQEYEDMIPEDVKMFIGSIYMTEEGYIIEVLHGQGTVIDVYGKEEYETHLNEVNKRIENTK
jgi:hypothetical protein